MMQTEDDFGKSTMLNSPSNIIKKLPNEDIENENIQRSVILTAKKEPRDGDRLSFCGAKNEPREDDQSILDNSSSTTKPKGFLNDDKGEDSLNGVLDITETSSDDENTESSDDTKDRVGNSLKKEEFNEVKMLDDQDNTLNDDDDLSYTNGSNDQFPFNLDNNDQLSNDFLEDEGVDNPLGESEGGDADDGTDDPNEDLDADNTGEGDEDEDNALRETDDNNDCDINLQINDESASDLNDSADRENAADEQSGSVEKNTSSENEPAESMVEKSVPSEDTEKEPEQETHDNRRPASRESTTSTTSNSSERLIIRSATDLNKLVVSVADAFIKKEKISQDQSEEQVKEKPHGGLSVVNPSQLGVSHSGGENLLQNVNFAQPNDQMNVINYVGCSAVAAQCDVCEVQFPDNIILADHRASAGHYKCALNADCTALVFSSMTELSAHQQSAHGVIPQSPVQQLAHQVQSLPIPYQMDQQMNNNYRTMQQYPPQSNQTPVRSMMPQVYPGQQNNVQQIRGYSIANQPRLHIGSVRGNVPTMAQPPNLKRPAVPPPQPRITPTKRSRTDYMRNGDTDCKVVSVQKPDNTDDVVAQLSKSITITARQDTRKKNDTAAVTNMLANRGITVSSVPAKQNQNNSAVQMLNLNSAVSLIPTNNANNRQGRANGRQMAPVNPSRLQTVDLTGPDPPRNLQMMSQTRKTPRSQCQICDRMFATPEQLNQHMITHGNVNRNKQMAYKCNQCTAQYPNQQQLQHHKQTFHRESISGTNEMVIPVVNLKQPGTMQKLSAIGVHHIIPLNALGTQSANGTFGIPILPLSSDRNQQMNMSSCGITNILPIGPLKTLGRM